LATRDNPSAQSRTGSLPVISGRTQAGSLCCFFTCCAEERVNGVFVTGLTGLTGCFQTTTLQFKPPHRNRNRNRDRTGRRERRRERCTIGAGRLVNRSRRRSRTPISEALAAQFVQSSTFSKFNVRISKTSMPHAPCPMPHAPCPMPHAPGTTLIPPPQNFSNQHSTFNNHQSSDRSDVSDGSERSQLPHHPSSFILHTSYFIIHNSPSPHAPCLRTYLPTFILSYPLSHFPTFIPAARSAAPDPRTAPGKR